MPWDHEPCTHATKAVSAPPSRAPPAWRTRAGRPRPSPCGARPPRSSRRASRSLRILHLSDLHLVPGQTKKQDWVRSLRELRPDAVIVTGDFLSHLDAVPHVLDTLDPLFEVPGAFVLGSNDYYAPRPLNPARYLAGPSQLEPQRPMLPWGDLVDGLTTNGWLDVGNARGTMKVDGREVDVRGVDDPHISRDRYDEVAGPFDADADLALGVTHAPYLRVLDAMVGGRRRSRPRRAHARRAAVRPRRRRPRDQLRPAAPAGQGAVQHDGGAARVRGPRHLALRPGPLRLPPRGDPAHPHPAPLTPVQS